jgi:anaerobic ribonucleoside-triphosphate reductase activating protein
MQDSAGGREVAIEPLAREIAAAPGIEGLSLSGGEPFEQAAAAAALVAMVRALNPQLTILAYSGFTYEELGTSGDCGRLSLLHQLDYLIDGPYVADLNLPQHEQWRGSSNQRFLCLSERARARRLLLAPQVTARVGQGRVEISGFPSDDLMQQVRQTLMRLGFEVSDEQ